MTPRPLVLAVDLGSGGPKVGYVTVMGEPVWWWYERADAVHGAAVQDPVRWWDLVVDAARRGITEGGVDGAAVVGVAVTGQWASTVPVDEHGIPVGECLMWSDVQGAKYSAARFGGPVAGYAPRVLATWLRRNGGVPNPGGADPVSHMLYLEHDRPDVTARARWYLEPVDYLTMRFSGVAAASPMSMTASWLTDNRDLDRLDYDPVLVAMAGINADRLPPLVPSGSIIGPVRPDVAELIGISPHAQVLTGTLDLHNAAVAAGAIELGQAHASLGTSAWASCPVSKKKTDVIRQIGSFPGIGDGNYIVVNNQDNAGRALEWYRGALAPDVDYDILADEAAGAVPGAGGVIFTPWLTGERTPIDDRRARGGFHNVSIAATRGDLTRAVMEGVAMNLRWLLEAAERFAGHRFDPIRLIGGGAQLDLWCQILADVCDRTFERVADPLVGGLRGGGLLVGMALGEVDPAELHSLVAVDAVFQPDPAHRAVYDALFREFPGLHANNKRMFRRLNGRPRR